MPNWTRLSESFQPIRKRVKVTGIVQGVGFRPFVWQRAQRHGLKGHVLNDSSGVTIEVQGSDEQINEFLEGFEEAAPPLARIHLLEVTRIPTASDDDFVIIESVATHDQSTPVSPEISVCDDCLRELQEPANRRFRYPFINCTNCGPRFTIVEDLPYDRPLTTMKSFAMCPQCLREYQDPANRRFHAQPNACADCGPQVWFVSPGEPEEHFRQALDAPRGESALAAFQDAIARGKIVAVKGVGGFHLACDATNDDAIAELRGRKGRVDKPLAIMVRDVQQAGSVAQVSHQDAILLTSRERPIVLLKKKTVRRPRATAAGQTSGQPPADPSLDVVEWPLSELVAPGNNYVGVMLPYTPLHYLLLEHERPLVMTSGNISDEPIARENLEAKQRLQTLADYFLLHDREIYVVCDDSVVRSAQAGPVHIRRSRGYAPMPLRLTCGGPSVLAVGGEIKGTFCVTKNQYAYPSQHLGDMINLETLEAMQRSVDHFLRLFRIQPQAIVADLHPDYHSGRWAERLAESLSIPLMRIQHHYAHVLSLIAESAWPPDKPLLGCVFDGTGFGTDRAIWGGEFIVADSQHYQRIAQLQYVPLPGGDSSIRCPWRVALAHLFAAGLAWDERLPCVAAASAAERKLLQQQLEKNLNCVPTSSMGRLFDAVASLIGIRHVNSYEAQAAMELESLAEEKIRSASADLAAYDISLSGESLISIDSAGLIQQVCGDLLGGLDVGIIAARFHHAVAIMVSQVCRRARRQFGINAVGLSGGVFQNALLSTLTTQKLRDNGFVVLTHRKVPCNDGGISLGQALAGQRRLSSRM